MTGKNIPAYGAGAKKSHKIWRIAKPILTVVLLALLVVQISAAVLIWRVGEDAVHRFPVFLLQVESDSMYPRYRAGDGILSANVPFEKLKTGDTITWFSGDTLVTHEIVRINDDGTVTTQGRANDYEDGNIPEEYYVGKAILRIPYLDGFLELTGSPLGKGICIALILLLCFGTIPIRSGRKIKK